MRVARTLERLLLVIGVVLCLFYLAAMAHRELGARLALRSFELAKEATGDHRESVHAAGPAGDPDYSLWSPKRVAAYKDALVRQFAPPLAVLRIKKFGLEVPVFDGTDDLILNRGVGRIAGTARPGQPGNVGIAGHRDGFFRCLKDIAVGDSLTLEASGTVAQYVVDRITIVAPDDVSVLEPATAPSLTLVTCYPFYFAGDAPRRYIIGCSRVEPLRNFVAAGDRSASLTALLQNQEKMK